MIGKRLAHICIIATFSLLAFVFSAWIKPVQSVEPQQVSQLEQFCYVVPRGSSVFLAEVKPRIIGFSGSSTVSLFVTRLLPFQYVKAKLLDQQELAFENAPRPLWLLNRSLLI